MRRIFRSAIFPLIVIVALVFFAETVLHNRQGKTAKVVYSEFISQVQESPGSIKDVTVDDGKHQYVVNKTDGTKYHVSIPPSDQLVASDVRLLDKNGVTIKTKGPGGASILGVIINLLPFVLLLGFWIFLMNQVQGGGSKV